MGNRDARRILFRVHAVPGRGEPGHAAADLRISIHDVRTHGHGGLECVAVRRRLRARGKLPDGRALQSPFHFTAHFDAACGEPHVRASGQGHRRQPGHQFRAGGLRPFRRTHPARSPRRLQRPGLHRSGASTAEFFRQSGRGRRDHRLGSRKQDHADRGGQSHVPGAAQAAGAPRRMARTAPTSSAAKARRWGCRWPQAVRTSAS
jgi:hypothetical protein